MQRCAEAGAYMPQKSQNRRPSCSAVVVCDALRQYSASRRQDNGDTTEREQ